VLDSPRDNTLVSPFLTLARRSPFPNRISCTCSFYFARQPTPPHLSFLHRCSLRKQNRLSLCFPRVALSSVRTLFLWVGPKHRPSPLPAVTSALVKTIFFFKNFAVCAPPLNLFLIPPFFFFSARESLFECWSPPLNRVTEHPPRKTVFPYPQCARELSLIALSLPPPSTPFRRLCCAPFIGTPARRIVLCTTDFSFRVTCASSVAPRFAP